MHGCWQGFIASYCNFFAAFRPKFSEEQIGLLEIEDFKKEAPEHFLSGIEDPHELQLQRLAFEKFQRQELVRWKALLENTGQADSTRSNILAPFSSIRSELKFFLIDTRKMTVKSTWREFRAFEALELGVYWVLYTLPLMDRL